MDNPKATSANKGFEGFGMCVPLVGGRCCGTRHDGLATPPPHTHPTSHMTHITQSGQCSGQRHYILSPSGPQSSVARGVSCILNRASLLQQRLRHRSAAPWGPQGGPFLAPCSWRIYNIVRGRSSKGPGELVSLKPYESSLIWSISTFSRF